MKKKYFFHITTEEKPDNPYVRTIISHGLEAAKAKVEESFLADKPEVKIVDVKFVIAEFHEL